MAEKTNYWEDRAVILSESLLNKGEKFYKNLAAAYELAGSRISKEIDAFYNRFAKDNAMTYAAAKKLLTSDERKSFIVDIKDYISRAEQVPHSPEWSLRLKNASRVHRVTRLEYLNVQMRQQVEEVYGKYASGMKGLAAETFEEGYYRSLYESELAAGKGLPFATLDTKTVQQIIGKPWTADGMTFSDKIWRDRDKLVDYLHTEMSQAFIRGESAERLIKDVVKRFDVSSKNAERLILTEMAYFSAISKKESYVAQGFRKYIIIAVLDEKTSAICRDMNQEVFDVEDFKPGVTANPFHPHCRSTTAPFVEKYDGVLGSGMVKDPLTGEMTKIPRDMSYKEWLNARMKEAAAPDGRAGQVKNVVPLADAPVNVPVLIDKIKPDMVESKLREYALSIKDNNFETAFIVTENGEVYRVKGDKDSVDWSGVPTKGARILHNHPLNEDGWADSFGRDDYAFMQAVHDFAEMLLATSTRYYKLKLLKELDLPGNEVYRKGAAMAFNARAFGQIQHYMMLYLKERGYIDYTWEDID